MRSKGSAGRGVPSFLVGSCKHSKERSKRFKTYTAGDDLLRWLVNSGGELRYDLGLPSGGDLMSCLLH